MRKNKGYSLVELMIALAIFSLVMIGIVTILRSTSSSYKYGLEEARVQEESQIAANQITELLLDATAVTSVTSPYGFKNANGQQITLGFNDTEKKVYYTVDGSMPHVIAENVEDFKIEGLAVAANADNRATIVLDVKNSGASHQTKKEVSFRNHIEDAVFDDIPHVGGISGGGASAYAAEVEVRRYEEVNVSAEFDIVKNASLNSAAAGKYVLYEKTNSLLADGAAKTYIVRLKSTFCSDFNATVNKSLKCELTGEDKDGNTQTILLFTEKVQFGNDTASKNIFVVDWGQTTNNGFGTYVDVKGININEAMNPSNPVFTGVDAVTGGPITISYTTELSNGTTTYVNNNAGSMSFKTNCLEMKPNGVSGNYKNGGTTIDFIEIGMVSDPNSNGVFITQGNTATSVKSGAAALFMNKKSKATFKLNIGGKSVDVTYNFFIDSSTNLKDFN